MPYWSRMDSAASHCSLQISCQRRYVVCSIPHLLIPAALFYCVHIPAGEPDCDGPSGASIIPARQPQSRPARAFKQRVDQALLARLDALDGGLRNNRNTINSAVRLSDKAGPPGQEPATC